MSVALAVAELHEPVGLRALVERASSRLASATTAAEVLDARDEARIAYDAAKSAGRFARAKQAHDEIIGTVHRAQADALQIEAAAQGRLADEYDAAQERGEVASGSVRTDIVPHRNDVRPATAADLGLTRKDVYEARVIRDAEKADPGIVKRTLDARIAEREEPTKAALRQAVVEAASRGLRSAPAPSRKNPIYRPNPQSDAVLRIVGCCTTISDSIARHDAEFILGGFHDAEQRRRNLNLIAKGRDDLTYLLEQADVE